MAIVTGDRYLESLVRYVESSAEALIEGSLVLKLNPVGLRYVQSRLEALAELESLLAGAPVDYLRAYVSDLGDHRALEQLRRILRLLPSLKVVCVLTPPARDPTPLYLLPFTRLKVLELRGCDLSTSAARGLLELRHTLEKLICHNSTDALRHIFASRIAEIKSSPQWNRLSFASCAYNSLLLMDESLQLLPAVETLDLSRNKFTKLDNLRKCTKLRHLDLGFNHLRTVASFSEVSCSLVKLVLRNNALTTLNGIQHLKSLDGLDVSYNMISNFSELEILASLPCLLSLLLQGNPICFARWYRPKVFSYLPFPNNLTLDEKKISTRDLWKRKLIIASRQQRPASFGFYSPAKDHVEVDGSVNMKRSRISRLVSIESEDESTFMCSEQDIGTIDNDDHSKKDDPGSDEEADTGDLMNRIESMKKERSDLWLREFREWMSPASQSSDVRKYTEANEKGNLNMEGEMSRDSFQFSGDDNSTNILESDNSFADTSISLNVQSSLSRIGELASKFLGHSNGDSLPVVRSFSTIKQHLAYLNDEWHIPSKSKNSSVDSSQASVHVKLKGEDMIRASTATSSVIEAQSSSMTPGSPPHYQEDILHRRHNLEEEFLELSALSVASSDSDTSYSEDDSIEFDSCIPQVDLSLISNFSEKRFGNSSSTPCLDNACHDGDSQNSPTKVLSHAVSSNGPGATNRDSRLGRIFPKRKSLRRVVSLEEQEKDGVAHDTHQKSDGDLEISKGEMRQLCQYREAFNSEDTASAEESLQARVTAFLSAVNIGVSESCKQFLCCRCLLLEQSESVEMDVAVLNSENKLYLLHVDGEYDGSVIGGTKLLGSYEIGDVRKVFIGLGLEVIRVCCKDTSYLFIKLSVDRCRTLLSLLDSFDTSLIQDSCRSLEQIQVDIFARHVCGGSKLGIFQYSMVLFSHGNLKENPWFSRSLFVIKWQLIVCVEDLKQFCHLQEGGSLSSYFVVDHSCSITNISEMVIYKDRNRVTLALECTLPGKRGQEYATPTEKQLPSSSPVKWKLIWFSQECLLKFVALLRAMHDEVSASPIPIRYIP